MQIGMVGLGRMGANMARRMARKNVQVAVYDVSPEARSALEHERGITPHTDLAALGRPCACRGSCGSCCHPAR